MKQISIALCLLLSLQLYAQNKYNLTGTILVQDQNIVENGDVLLTDSQNGTIIKYTFIKDGKFTFLELTEGKYIITVTCLGYKKASKEVVLDTHKKIEIELSKETIHLDEVTIKGTKNNISFKDGNISVQIENSIFESLPSTTDVLSKLPGIQISPDQESLSIIGRGTPLLYLDNQRIDFDQLQSISVSDIKDIQIIDNPPAKYEAEGRTLILITRKRNKNDGYKIHISEVASFKRRFSNYSELKGDFKRKKLELQGNFNYNQIGFWESSGSRLNIPRQNIRSEYDAKAIGPRPQFIIGSGFFYEVNDTDYISGRINYRTQRDKFPIRTNSTQQIGEVEDFIISESANDAPRSFLTSNLNLSKKLNNTDNLFFGLQYSNYKRDLKSTIFNNINEGGFQLSQNRNQTYEIGSFAARIDFEKQLKKHLKMEVGGTVSIGNAIAFSDFEFLNTDDRIISTYDYDEDIYATYAQLSGSIKKITYNIGTRVETNFVKGAFRNSSSLLVNREQTRVFPNLRINIPVDSTKTITINYNKTINRPGYLNASSISTFINPLVEFERNVNLRSTLTEEIVASIQHKKSNLRLNYFTIRNPIFFSSVYNPQENRITTSPENFNEETGYSLQFRNTLSYKTFSTTNLFNLTYSKINDLNALNIKTRPYFYYYSNSELKIKPKITIGVNFWGLSKRYQGIFERNAMFILGASYNQTVLKNLRFSINVNDIFRNMNFNDRYTVNGIITNDTFYANAQELSFSLKYSFGKERKSSFKNKNVDDNLNRMN